MYKRQGKVKAGGRAADGGDLVGHAAHEGLGGPEFVLANGEVVERDGEGGEAIVLSLIHILIHGQVATQWNSTLGSNLILVANDEVSTNTMRQNLMKMAAPTGVQTRFFSIQKTIDVIHKASPAQKIFIVLDLSLIHIFYV